MIYTLPFDNIACGAVADTYNTIAAAKVDNTAGHRIRIRRLTIGPADDTPDDRDIAVQLKRVDLSASGASAGTAASTITSANIPKFDLDAVAAPFTGYVDFLSGTGAAEPSTYETNPPFQDAFNTRKGLNKEWAIDDADMIIVPQNYLVGILLAPRAALAMVFSGEMVVEWF